MLDSGAQRGVGNVPEIPRYQKVDAVCHRNRNVGRILGRFVWNGFAIKQVPGENLGFHGSAEKSRGFERPQTGAGRVLIASTGFRDNQVRSDQIESARRIAPPLARDFLKGCYDNIA